ncbi:hypothetical protein COU58_01835 [Candidatus Pacearchaeota archaeon CG10_big_fil_rev_8_21_14_0_10_32_42]|nr:MAG: hypothetical protein COU58_01835 [Candidatus Pacearchaeota archaeon CG10_big_fil_rev_8_21_14_0_10_32_42]
MEKRGEILVENIIFIVLNIAFLSILVIFLLNQGSGESILEDSYSKQVALLIDSAKPGMIMRVNFENAKEVSDENGISFSEILLINDQYVTTKLNEDSGRSYHFFNDINVSSYYPEKNNDGDFTGFYVLTFSRKNVE